jgi:hypothetical protein
VDVFTVQCVETTRPSSDSTVEEQDDVLATGVLVLLQIVEDFLDALWVQFDIARVRTVRYGWNLDLPGESRFDGFDPFKVTEELLKQVHVVAHGDPTNLVNAVRGLFTPPRSEPLDLATVEFVEIFQPDSVAVLGEEAEFAAVLVEGALGDIGLTAQEPLHAL